MLGLTYGGPPGEEKFMLASGNGDILSSPDGEQWTLEGTDLGYLRDVTYGNFRYVAVGEGGSVAVSDVVGEGSICGPDKGTVSVPAFGWLGLGFLLGVMGFLLKGLRTRKEAPVF
jgi:hypothetical protein